MAGSLVISRGECGGGSNLDIREEQYRQAGPARALRGKGDQCGWRWRPAEGEVRRVNRHWVPHTEF